MDDTAVVVAFWLLALLTLGSALMVAVVRDAGLYITLSADFVAVVQVLVYAGAISVLMLFAILLTPRSARDNAPVPYAAPIAALAGLVGAVVVFVALKTDWAKVEDDRFGSTAEAIGAALIDPFVLPFEVASLLLVVAMVGAIILVRPPEEGP